MYEEQGAQRYTFKAEWREVENCRVTEFLLSYFIIDGTIELFDTKRHRMFLKRTKCPPVSLQDLFIGNSVNIMSRQIHITHYGDIFTRQQMELKMQRTFGLIKPDQIDNLGPILQAIHEEGFTIGGLKMVTLSNEQGMQLYSSLSGTPEQSQIVSHIISGPVVAIELLGNYAVQGWSDFVGPKDPAEARKSKPRSLIARFGRDLMKNGFHCSDNPEEVENILAMFFSEKANQSGNGPSLTATFKNSTCCILKPHAFQAGLLGPILTTIQAAGFHVTGIRMLLLDHSSAEEFLEVYCGVMPEYPAMVTQLCSGSCVVIEVAGKDELTATQFRELVGPSDPELARKLRPSSLRAKFGINKVLNAVHCTDLPEDALLEVEYFFKLL